MNSNGKVRQMYEGHRGSAMSIAGLAIVMALVLYGLSIGALLTSAQSTTPTATPTTLEIGANDLFFKPNLATIPADTPVEIVVTNDGAIRHNFSITDHNNSGLKNLNISFDIDPGKSGTATITAPAGVYYFYCNEPGHEQAGMFGYVTVQKNASITTSEATVTPRAG